MSAQDNGGPAFPVATATYLQQSGMTLRDYFAAKAMQGFMANKANPMRFDPDGDAVWAYTIADAMLRERAK